MACARDEQREAEMARGREIAARHAAEAAPQKTLEDRLELLARYESIVAPKVGVMATAAQHFPFRLTYEGKNKVARIEGEYICGEVWGPAFPTDQFVATCVLAVNALIPPDWVPQYSQQRLAAIATRQRRDVARTHVVDWKEYPDGM